MAIVAPQRELVPQVDVSMTALTPSSRSFWAMPVPIALQLCTVVVFPEQE